MISSNCQNPVTHPLAPFSTCLSSSKPKTTSSECFSHISESVFCVACFTIVSSVWNLLINGLGYIESISKTRDMKQHGEQFAIDCIRPTIERVGLEDQAGDDYSMPKLRFFDFNHHYCAHYLFLLSEPLLSTSWACTKIKRSLILPVPSST